MQIISRPTSEGEAAGQPLRVRALMQLGGAQRMRLLIAALEQQPVRRQTQGATPHRHAKDATSRR